MIFHAVFADFTFCGLYRSESAAKRLVSELSLLPGWQQSPIIKKMHGEFTEEEFLSFGWGARSAYWTCVNAMECSYFGRAKWLSAK